MRSEFVGKYLRIQETLIRTTEGMSWGRVWQRLVGRRSAVVGWVVCRGLEDVLWELGDWGRMQDLRLSQQG